MLRIASTWILAINPNYTSVHLPWFIVYHKVKLVDGNKRWPFTAPQAFYYIRGHALGGMVVDYKGLYYNTYRYLVLGG
jgi:hypothetical protein